MLPDACSPPPAQGLPGASDAVSVTCTQSRSRATKLHRPLERDRERESPAQEGRVEGLEAEWLMRLTSESNGAEMAMPDSLSRYERQLRCSKPAGERSPRKGRSSIALGVKCPRFAMAAFHTCFALRGNGPARCRAMENQAQDLSLCLFPLLPVHALAPDVITGGDAEKTQKCCSGYCQQLPGLGRAQAPLSCLPKGYGEVGAGS